MYRNVYSGTTAEPSISIERPQPRRREPMDQFIDIDGIRTRYRRVGDGPDVLVLHGWGARIEAVNPIIDALARQCTVYAPDLPGFGDTEPPPQQPWGIADYESWTRALMTAL